MGIYFQDRQDLEVRNVLEQGKVLVESSREEPAHFGTCKEAEQIAMHVVGQQLVLDVQELLAGRPGPEAKHLQPAQPSPRCLLRRE